MVTCDLWTCDHEIFMNDMCFMWCMCYILCMQMDAVGHLLEALFATVFVVVIWVAEDFLCLFIRNPCVDPDTPPKKYEGESWSCGLGRRVTATFMAFATKTVDPGSFRFLICDWFTACLQLTHVIYLIYIYINKNEQGIDKR